MDRETRKELDFYKGFLKEHGLEFPGPHYLANLRLIAGNSQNEKTEIGNIIGLWKDYLKETPEGNLNLYIHIPYCYQKCHYCCYAGRAPEGNKKLGDYIDKLIRYFRFFSPVFKKTEFSNLHIGGGTPSILTAEMMEKMLSALFSSFRIDSKGQKSFEFNPSSSSLKKMKVLRKFGFNKASIGVQSFNKKTLKMNNRGDQTVELVKKSVTDALKSGFKWVNVDLLAGMYGDTERNVINSFKKAVKLSPHSIYLYSIKPTEYYLQDIYGMDMGEYFLMAKKTMESVIDEINLIAKKNNYKIAGFGAVSSLGYQNTWIFLKNGISPDNFYCFGREQDNSVFGIGPDSISYIRNRTRYQMTDELTANPLDYVFSVNPYDKEKSMLSYIFNDLSLTKSISRDNFKKIFGEDIIVRFKEPIVKLEKIKGVSLTDKEVIFESDLPGDRLLYALFFLGKEGSMELVNRKGLIKNTMNKKISKEKKKKEIKTEVSSIENFDEKLSGIMSQGKAKIIECNVTKTYKSSIAVISDKKKKKIFIDKNTKFIEVKNPGKEKHPSFIRNISVGDIKPNDKLAVLVYDVEGKVEGMLVRKIIS